MYSLHQAAMDPRQEVGGIGCARRAMAANPAAPLGFMRKLHVCPSSGGHGPPTGGRGDWLRQEGYGSQSGRPCRIETWMSISGSDGHTCSVMDVDIRR